MVDYKIVKYCKMCKKRFVVNKGEQRKYYCDICQKKYDKWRESEDKNERNS